MVGGIGKGCEWLWVAYRSVGATCACAGDGRAGRALHGVDCLVFVACIDDGGSVLCRRVWAIDEHVHGRNAGIISWDDKPRELPGAAGSNWPGCHVEGIEELDVGTGDAEGEVQNHGEDLGWSM